MKQRFSKRTRLVSALLTLAMVFTFLPFSALAEGPENVPIDKEHFPDEVFREYLNNATRPGTNIKIDDGDGFLSKAERNAITTINFEGGYKGRKLASLEGIEYFPKLASLNCAQNNLRSLDVSKNTALENLRCSNNPLNSLDLSTALVNLTCNESTLSSLDVRNSKNLYRLSCYGNNLSSLDVSNNTRLVSLNCHGNDLSSLNVSQNKALQELYCEKNNLTSLDVSNNTKLKILDCHQNKLPSLDVSNNTQLEILDCKNNQLTNLNVENTNIDIINNTDSRFDAQNNTYPIAVRSDRAFDLSTLHGFDASKADNWVGGTVKGNILTVDAGATKVTYTYDCGKGLSRDFALNVNVVPDGTVTPPSGGGSTGGTTPGGPTGGETGGGSGSSGGDGGGGGAIVVVAGAAAVGLVGYGIYNYVAERQLQALLPEGAASPENRAQTALLLWNTAGRPEPAAQPAFPDVADPDTAKAAQWCVEHGLMNAKFRGRFAPDGSSPAYKTLNAYRQLVG